MRSPIRDITIVLLSALSLAFASPAQAQNQRLNLIRDAEIEHILARYAKPLFQAAGLDTGAARTYIVHSPEINAFVAGGQRIFVFTGLIMRAETPGQLMGVLAHETGHIRGGHLVRTRDALASAQTIAILTALLGGAAAAAAGDGQAAGALVLGGSGAGTQMFLQYSRVQESAADQAGVELMERAGWSPKGLVEFLEILDRQEGLLGQGRDSYMRTHPLGFERIEALEHRMQNSPTLNNQPPAELVKAHSMMRAKLAGFVNEPQETLRDFPPGDSSDEARYARAVAYMREARTDDALKEIGKLIEAYPNNPYYPELKGQILLEGGRVEQSVEPLRQAYNRSQHAAVAVMLAQALIGLESPKGNDEAEELLNAVIRNEPDNAGAWEQLAVVYGRQGKLAESRLANAEHYFNIGQFEFAREQVQYALPGLKPNSPDYYRALDVQNAIEAALRRGN